MFPKATLPLHQECIVWWDQGLYKEPVLLQPCCVGRLSLQGRALGRRSSSCCATGLGLLLCDPPKWLLMADAPSLHTDMQ